MTPGMPGAGIGGIFYLLSAVLMPFRELYRTLRGRSSLARWLGVGRHFGIAMMIAGSVWATGWALGVLLASGADGREEGTSAMEIVRVSNVLGVGPLVAALAALASVVATVEVVSLARRGLRGRAGAQDSPPADAGPAESALRRAA